MHITQKNITDKMYLLIFNSQKEITETFLRFQEYYESPKFKGKIFSLDELKKWYTQNSLNGKRTNKFTYYSDWNGFNIPSYVLKPFFKGRFNPLSKQEEKFLRIFRDKLEPYYIVGVHKKIKSLNAYLKHELAHGMFYTNKNYKNEVLNSLSEFNVEPIKKELMLMNGYHKEVLEDEVHAYSLDAKKTLKTPIPKDLSKNLKEIFQKYLKEEGIKFPSLM